MRQSEDFENRAGGLPLVYMTIGATVFALIILGFVVVTNEISKGKSKTVVFSETIERSSNSNVIEERTSNLVSQDLGFWNMYPEEATEEEIQQIVVEEKVEEEPFADGNHIELILRDGTSEWVPIDSNLEKNSYDFSNLVSKNNIYKYYANGKQASFFGINLSRYEKDVNFNLLKNAGVDYVMIRVGARGYATGELQIDDTFSSQMEAAKEIGMPVGVYFASQAITKEEAVQEAELVLAKIAEYDISYPVVFQMEYVDNDEARIETLTQNERTQIALAFLDRISSAGYTPMLYGDKDWLLKRIDLTKLEKYDIWISIQEDVPDYPYLYSMWLYSKQGKISGVSSEVEFNICFIDYSAR